MDLCEFGFERCIDELFVVPQSALFRTFSSTYFRLVDYSTSFGCSNIFIMPLILLHTEIAAPIERCFDLARSMEVHVLSMRASGERIVGGRKSGLIEVNETVTFRAKHFGITQELTGQISEMSRPYVFVDTMVLGAFKCLSHRHIFIQNGQDTMMKDEFYYTSPFGVFGKIADALFLKKYLEHILNERNSFIKNCAEGEGWQNILLNS